MELDLEGLLVQVRKIRSHTHTHTSVLLGKGSRRDTILKPRTAEGLFLETERFHSIILESDKVCIRKMTQDKCWEVAGSGKNLLQIDLNCLNKG